MEAILKYSIINWILKAIKATTADPNPKYPIKSVMVFNLFSNGVLFSSWALSIVPLIIPFWECLPVAIIIPLPLPSTTFVPQNNKFELGSFFLLFNSSKHSSYIFY